MQGQSLSLPEARRRTTRSRRDTVIVKGGGGATVWLVQDPVADGQHGLWRPLPRMDQQPLEDAASTGHPTVVGVEGGRAEVQLDKRLWVDRYGSEPPRAPRKVRRALWCREATGGWEPYEEDVSTELELAYDRLVNLAKLANVDTQGDQELPEVVELKPPYEGQQASLRLTYSATGGGGYIWGGQTPQNDSTPQKQWELIATETNIAAAGSWLSSGPVVKMQRGYGTGVVLYRDVEDVPLQTGEEEERILCNDVSRLFILVHGIGEKIWSKDGSGQLSQAPVMRQNFHRCTLSAAGFKQDVEGKWSLPEDVDVPAEGIPKEDVIVAAWWETLHDEERDLRIQRITLPSVPNIREVANFAVADVLFYSQTAQREKMINAVISAIEAAVQKFRHHHPSFDGDVVLVGHSLGGVILFDILKNSLLKTHVVALFLLGSPVGMFLHCSDSVPPPEYALPNRTRLFNIFHPLDPIAYRLEPLLMPHLVDVPPEQIPSQGYFGETKVHHAIGHLWNYVAGAGKKTWDTEGGKWLNLNKGSRVDWALQDDLSILGGTVEMLNALASHSCYIKHPDVASFIRSQCASFALSPKESEPSDVQNAASD